MSEIRYIYGRNPVSEALRAASASVQRLHVLAGTQRGGRLADIIKTALNQGIPIVDAPKDSLDRLVSGAAHQGVIAEVAEFTYATVDDILAAAAATGQPPLLVVLDQIQDPHNLGSLIRSSFALGAHGIVMPKDRACEITGTVMKTSAGAAAHLPVARVTNLRRALDDLKEAGLWIFGTVADEGQPLYKADFTRSAAIVIGSEGAGMRRLVREACDVLVGIPMPGDLGSLNASVAGGICLYEALRQRTPRTS